MKKLLIIKGSPREDGICQELINQVRKYFLDCEIKLYDSYKLSPSPCTDCKWCEYHDGCSNKDLDIFFEDFEDADYIALFTPVYNNFYPAPVKAILDRFQRYYNARFKRGANPPIKKAKRVGVVIASGSNTNQVQAMADNVREALGRAGHEPRQVEGYGSANWILMDYNDIIVHIFSDESRTFYDLERIWRDGQEVSVEEFETEAVQK